MNRFTLERIGVVMICLTAAISAAWMAQERQKKDIVKTLGRRQDTSDSARAALYEEGRAGFSRVEDDLDTLKTLLRDLSHPGWNADEP